MLVVRGRYLCYGPYSSYGPWTSDTVRIDEFTSVNCISLVALRVFHSGCEWEISFYGPYSSYGP